MTTRKLPLILLLMAVMVSAGSLVLVQSARAAAFPGGNGKIAFVREVAPAGTPANNEIFVMNPDGSGQTQLTFSPLMDVHPDWSSDGTKIAFTRWSTTESNIWTMNADGSNQKQLTTYAAPEYSVGSPSWSPDGKKIAFWITHNGLTGIYVINSDGSGAPQQLTTPTSYGDYWPSWSPDGTKIAFGRYVGGGASEIWVMNADGSGAHRVTGPAASVEDFHPCWSPDGTKIVFVNGPAAEGQSAIWVMNSDGSNAHGITTEWGVLLVHPAWSPDGSKITFAKRDPNDGSRNLQEIWVMNADGSGQIQITTNNVLDTYPAWQRMILAPVGGIVMPTNKLEIVAPFAALAGLIVAVSAVVVVKRRRD